MLQHLRPALVLLFAMTVLTGLAYPLAITGVAGVVFPDGAGGSLIRKADGGIVGSRLIGQAFTGDSYFHPRLSAAGQGYDAGASSGSNLGPTSQALIDRIREEGDALRQQGMAGPLPADSVTASASGLDPDISPDFAALQIPRVAKARGLSAEGVTSLVSLHTAGRGLGLLGEPTVNVLELNMALDALQP
jgi:K+-transporting ATPase ATPase C chain